MARLDREDSLDVSCWPNANVANCIKTIINVNGINFVAGSICEFLVPNLL
jgi:hypothetical protein